jgi:quinol monooxygenase YgiN
MSKIALVVEFNIKAGKRDAFLKIIRGHAAEMYRDAAALDIHIASPRLQATRGAYGDMIESRNIAKTRVDGS